MNLKMVSDKGGEHDVLVSENQLVFTTGDEYVLQKAKQLLLTMKGDWFRDTEFGLPWVQQIFQKPFNLEKTKGLM